MVTNFSNILKSEREYLNNASGYENSTDETTGEDMDLLEVGESIIDQDGHLQLVVDSDDNTIAVIVMSMDEPGFWRCPVNFNN